MTLELDSLCKGGAMDSNGLPAIIHDLQLEAVWHDVFLTVKLASYSFSLRCFGQKSLRKVARASATCS